jgi:hypothetical protein
MPSCLCWLISRLADISVDARIWISIKLARIFLSGAKYVFFPVSQIRQLITTSPPNLIPLSLLIPRNAPKHFIPTPLNSTLFPTHRNRPILILHQPRLQLSLHIWLRSSNSFRFAAPLHRSHCYVLQAGNVDLGGKWVDVDRTLLGGKATWQKLPSVIVRSDFVFLIVTGYWDRALVDFYCRCG